jgi:hypothetical protein
LGRKGERGTLDLCFSVIVFHDRQFLSYSATRNTPKTSFIMIPSTMRSYSLSCSMQQQPTLDLQHVVKSSSTIFPFFTFNKSTCIQLDFINSMLFVLLSKILPLSLSLFLIFKVIEVDQISTSFSYHLIISTIHEECVPTHVNIVTLLLLESMYVYLCK